MTEVFAGLLSWHCDGDCDAASIIAFFFTVSSEESMVMIDAPANDWFSVLTIDNTRLIQPENKCN